jgi:UDP-3-O-[3-hydroxymyristoyl] glucosamine N-acyltransferase
LCFRRAGGHSWAFEHRADMTTIAAQSGIVKNVDTKGQKLAGMPAIPIKDWHKQSILLKNMVDKKDWIK